MVFEESDRVVVCGYLYSNYRLRKDYFKIKIKNITCGIYIPNIDVCVVVLIVSIFKT